MDPIADMLTIIRNGYAVRKKTVSVPYSKLKYEILKILKSEGFIEEVKKRGKRQKRIVVRLRYENDRPAIRGIKRISKLSRRIYLKKDQLYSPKSGYGVLIVSTPKGLLTSKQARKMNTGGEAICEVW